MLKHLSHFPTSKLQPSHRLTCTHYFYKYSVNFAIRTDEENEKNSRAFMYSLNLSCKFD